MHDSGVVDVQSHTRWHAMIFGHDSVADFVAPGYEREPMLNRPLESELGGAFLGPDALGTPLYVRRSRMSNARRFLPDRSAAERCRAHVARHGGRAFFARPGWRAELEPIARTGRGQFEDDATRAAVIREELAEGRAMLNEQVEDDHRPSRRAPLGHRRRHHAAGCRRHRSRHGVRRTPVEKPAGAGG